LTTIKGGIKAVIWTDVIQCLLMMLGLLMVIVTGTIEFGSLVEPFRILESGNRLIVFNGEFNIYRSDVFWSVFLGCLVGWTGVYCVQQTQIQRYCCLRSKKHARTALWIHVPITVAIAYMAIWCGVIIYAKYSRCDPMLTERIERHDQLMPFYVMDTLGSIPGLPGVFVACVFSGALRCVTISSA
jgi:Na+/proline symporter